ncbi:MAG: UDP pyrophosphate phosphatase [Tenericutes bacterium]|nr:UDP pyrophosphate phosphatase [Mycoplasmatota bacterium]
MEILKYLLLSVVQGLTETIPVSSSGHLMIIKKLISLDVDFNTIAILTNFGSLIAILIIFWKDIVSLINSFFKYLSTKETKYKSEYKYCWMIVLGCIPAGLMGLVVNKLELFAKIENNIKIVGLSLIITSVLLFIVRNFKGKKSDSEIGVHEALTVGAFQIIGLFPGISRSGSTIVGGMSSGLKRDTAFKYSFMLYIPMSVAATGLELTSINLHSDLILYYAVAIIVSTIVTLLVTKWFRKIVNNGKLIYFSIYCLIVGLLVILFL